MFPAVSEIEHVPWNRFLSLFAKRAKQGEHIFINGQTGSGKTELLFKLMALYRNGVVFVTKPRDPIFKSPLSQGYKRAETWNPTSTDYKYLLAPKNGDSTAAQVGNQREVFGPAVEQMYKDGGWTIGLDETLWLTDRLKLGQPLGAIAYMGRALGLTGIYCTQRPRYIPVIIPQSASHAFLGRVRNTDDRKVLAELGGDMHETMAGLRQLRDKHDFLYVDTQSELPMMIVNTQK